MADIAWPNWPDLETELASLQRRDARWFNGLFVRLAADSRFWQRQLPVRVLWFQPPARAAGGGKDKSSPGRVVRPAFEYVRFLDYLYS